MSNSGRERFRDYEVSTYVYHEALELEGIS